MFGSYLRHPDVMHEVVLDLHPLVWDGNIQDRWKSWKTLLGVQEKLLVYVPFLLDSHSLAVSDEHT